MTFMNRKPNTFVDTLLKDDASLEGVRRAFRNLEEAVVQSHQSLQKQKEQIERDMKNGGRATKKRFHL